MDFTKVVTKRRMVRNFSDEPISNDEVDRILDLARRGPSAGFSQGQDFVVVTDKGKKVEIAALCGEKSYAESGFHPFISGAPVLIVPCTNEAAYHRRYQEEPDKLRQDGSEIDWPVPYWFMDIGAAIMVILLAAVDEGLAAGFAGVWNLDELRDHFGHPEGSLSHGSHPDWASRLGQALTIPEAWPAASARSRSSPVLGERPEVTEILHPAIVVLTFVSATIAILSKYLGWQTEHLLHQ